ncbi:hypothetical protein SNEBB_004320 [Seison nebaliae]|nr:hypothetical protein SNEBB_004320 [Seison nebaliae]
MNDGKYIIPQIFEEDGNSNLTRETPMIMPVLPPVDIPQLSQKVKLNELANYNEINGIYPSDINNKANYDRFNVREIDKNPSNYTHKNLDNYTSDLRLERNAYQDIYGLKIVAEKTQHRKKPKPVDQYVGPYRNELSDNKRENENGSAIMVEKRALLTKGKYMGYFLLVVLGVGLLTSACYMICIKCIECRRRTVDGENDDNSSNYDGNFPSCLNPKCLKPAIEVTQDFLYRTSIFSQENEKKRLQNKNWVTVRMFKEQRKIPSSEPPPKKKKRKPYKLIKPVKSFIPIPLAFYDDSYNTNDEPVIEEEKAPKGCVKVCFGKKPKNKKVDTPHIPKVQSENDVEKNKKAAKIALDSTKRKQSQQSKMSSKTKNKSKKKVKSEIEGSLNNNSYQSKIFNDFNSVLNADVCVTPTPIFTFSNNTENDGSNLDELNKENDQTKLSNKLPNRRKRFNKKKRSYMRILRPTSLSKKCRIRYLKSKIFMRKSHIKATESYDKPFNATNKTLSHKQRSKNLNQLQKSSITSQTFDPTESEG